VWESGSVRYYGHRRTILWDALDPDGLDAVLAELRGRGLRPYFLFERTEESEFRGRFARSEVGAVDWPPMAEVGGEVRIFNPDDRGRYAAGERVATEYVR
jgi:hypothetical protein